MCFIISIVFFVTAYKFYELGLQTQAFMSAFLALVIFIFFIYRIIKNRKCFFGNDKDCNKKQ